jgi:hypothetical protein
MFREEIKEGKGAAHERTEAAFMAAAEKAKYPAHILALTSLTGTSLAVFLEGHATFASIAKAQGALDTPEFGKLDRADAEMRTSQRSVLAVYRGDLSYAAGKMDLPKARFFTIETIRVKQDQVDRFAELARLVVAGAEKSGSTQPVATYQAVSGAPSGTFYLLQPMESLQSMDEEAKRNQAMVQAMPNGAENMRELTGTIANEESILFVVDPVMSYVPKEWESANPAFWERKPEPPNPKAPAAKK